MSCQPSARRSSSCVINACHVNCPAMAEEKESVPDMEYTTWNPSCSNVNGFLGKIKLCGALSAVRLEEELWYDSVELAGQLKF